MLTCTHAFLLDVKEDMVVVKDEIFGPVVVVSKFKTIDEVVEKANNSTYGLAAAVFTSNITTSISVANQLEAGTVWINCYNELVSGMDLLLG